MNDPFGLTSPEMRANPYAVYARMRAEGGVHFSEPWAGWMLTRYADVVASFRNENLSSVRSSKYAGDIPDEVKNRLAPVMRNLSGWLIFKDPPDHTRLRGLIKLAFTPRVVEHLRAGIKDIVGTLLDAARARGDVLELVTDLANPLPVFVIGDLLGLAREDGPRLKQWSDALAGFLSTPKQTLEGADAARTAILAMEAHFKDAMAARRRSPGPDLISALVHAADETGVGLGEQDLVSMCTILLFAGHETTTNLVANGLLSLLRFPDQLAKLRQSLASMDLAVEELLRFEAPVQRLGRVALTDIEVGNQKIPSGERVWLVVGAANRDPEIFKDPDRLDIERGNNRQMAFGNGHHYCVGAALGRLEAQIAFAEILRRYPALALVDPEPDWTGNATFRSLASLRLATRG